MVNPQDAVVLYLAGKDDLDRREALRRGFKTWNLIAVDSDRDVVEKIRSQGGLAIHGDIFEILMSWKPEPKIDAVVIDLCCGCSDFIQHWFRRNWREGLVGEYGKIVVSINMLRGRETKYSREFSTMNMFDSKVFGFNMRDKHRGKNLLASILSILSMWLENQIQKYGERFIVDNAISAITDSLSPAFYSYRSTKTKAPMMFDSVVFKWMMKYESNILNKSIPAVKAHRTMMIRKLAA